MKKFITSTLAAGGLLALASALTPAANADTIITFGQTGGGNTVTGTGGLTGTTITGTNIPISISQIDAAVVTPVNAFLDLSAANISGVLGPLAEAEDEMGQRQP